MTNHTGPQRSTTAAKTHRQRCTIVAVIALGVVTNACGDSDHATDSNAGEPVSQSSTTTALRASDGDLEAWCFSWLDNSGISDANGTDVAMRAMLARVEAEAEIAPSEIAEPMRVHLEATRTFVEAMEAAGWEEENLAPEDLRALDPSLTDGVIETLDDYAAANCGRGEPPSELAATEEMIADASSCSELLDTYEVDTVTAEQARLIATRLEELAEADASEDGVLDDLVTCNQVIRELDPRHSEAFEGLDLEVMGG